MSVRRALVGGGPGCLALGALVACASFSAATPESDVRPPADASLVPDGSMDVAAPTLPSTPCDAQPGTTKAVGLYVLGGNVTNDDGVVTAEARSILRAPILCDGSLGPWAYVGQQARGFQYAAAGVIGDHLVISGGLSNEMPFYTSTVYVYGHGTDGGLSDYTPTNLGIVARWRHASVTAGDMLVLLGGLDANGSTSTVVETLRLDGEDIVTTTSTPMDHPRVRSSAAFADGRLVVIGRDDEPSAADVATDGTITGWRPLASGGRKDFDLVSATDGTKMYFLGGSNAPVDVTIATTRPAVDVALASGRPLVVPGVSGSAAATWRGRMYIVSGSLRRGAVSTTFTTSGVTDFIDEPLLPEARLGHVAVVF